MTVARRFFRYLALALATTQIVAAAGAPVLEARLAAAHVRNAVTDLNCHRESPWFGAAIGAARRCLKPCPAAAAAPL